MLAPLGILRWVRLIVLGVALSLSPISVSLHPLEYDQSQAGLLGKAAKAYISSRLLKAMFLHGSSVAREAAKRKFFEVLRHRPDLAEDALRAVQAFSKSPKFQQALSSQRGREIARDLEEATTRLAAWTKPKFQGQDVKVSRTLDSMYRKNPLDSKVGNGSTTDALRHELLTGEKVGGRGHAEKVDNAITTFEKWLGTNARTATPSDIEAVKTALRDLLNAKGPK